MLTFSSLRWQCWNTAREIASEAAADQRADALYRLAYHYWCRLWVSFLRAIDRLYPPKGEREDVWKEENKPPVPIKVNFIRHSVMSDGRILCELVDYNFEVVASYLVHISQVQKDLESMTKAIAAAKVMFPDGAN